ncbi:MAG: DUF2155 domain-containing protein [Beijerinckiaceae bacterium]
MIRSILCRHLSAPALAAAAFLAAAAPAAADKIKNPVAVFAGLDKITGRIISFETSINETVQFGALQLTVRVCYSRPPTEAANTTSFVEVDEITFNNEYRRIFSGWMFASSPGISSVEHAIYDLWLAECKGGTEIIPEAKEKEEIPDYPQRNVQQKPALIGTAAKPDPNKRAPGAPQRIDVAPQQGVIVAPVAPARRFFPTNPFSGGGGGTGGFAPDRMSN